MYTTLRLTIPALALLVPAMASPMSPATPSIPALAAPEAASAAGDPMVAKALGRIAQIETKEAALAAGDKQKAALLINQLGWATKRLGAVVQQNTAEWKAAKKRHDALLKKLQAKRDAAPGKTPPAGKTPPSGKTPPAGKTPPGNAPVYDHEKLLQLNKEISNEFTNIKMLQVKNFLDQNRVNGLKKTVAKFRERIAAFPPAHENVKLVTGNIDNYEGIINGALDQVAKDRAAEPAITARLNTLFDRYDDENFPLRIEPPYNEGQVRAWAQELKLRKETKIPEDIAWLQSVAANVAVKPNRVASCLSSLQTTEMRKITESEMFVTSSLDGFGRDGVRRAEDLLKIDPSDKNKVMQNVLGVGQFDRNMNDLKTALHRVEIARMVDEILGRTGAPNRDAQKEKLELAVGHLKEIAVISLDEMRMPKAASTSEELLKVARETLAREEYEAGKSLRTVINVDLVERSKREGYLDIDTVRSTVTFYDYRWKQFQVTTAEKVGDEVWLFANTLKFYESGDSTTPVGKWILSQRFELTPIKEENVQK